MRPVGILRTTRNLIKNVRIPPSKPTNVLIPPSNHLINNITRANLTYNYSIANPTKEEIKRKQRHDIDGGPLDDGDNRMPFPSKTAAIRVLDLIENNKNGLTDSVVLTKGTSKVKYTFHGLEHLQDALENSYTFKGDDIGIITLYYPDESNKVTFPNKSSFYKYVKDHNNKMENEKKKKRDNVELHRMVDAKIRYLGKDKSKYVIPDNLIDLEKIDLKLKASTPKKEAKVEPKVATPKKEAKVEPKVATPKKEKNTSSRTGSKNSSIHYSGAKYYNPLAGLNKIVKKLQKNKAQTKNKKDILSIS